MRALLALNLCECVTLQQVFPSRKVPNHLNITEAAKKGGSIKIGCRMGTASHTPFGLERAIHAPRKGKNRQLLRDTRLHSTGVWEQLGPVQTAEHPSGRLLTPKGIWPQDTELA